MIRELAQHIAQKAISENILMPFALYEKEDRSDCILNPMDCTDIDVILDIYLGLMKRLGENYTGILCVPINQLAAIDPDFAKAIEDAQQDGSDIELGFSFVFMHGMTIIETGIFTQTTVIPIPYPQGGNPNVTLN
jgi:hypothetical protein